MQANRPYPPQTPPEPHPAYAEEGGGMFSKIMPMILVIIAIGSLGGLGWYAYQQSIHPVGTDELPVITAKPEPYKIKPDNPGGMYIPDQDKMVYNTISSIPPKPVESEEEVKKPLPAETPVDRSAIEVTKGKDILVEAEEEGESAKEEKDTVKEIAELPQRKEKVVETNMKEEEQEEKIEAEEKKPIAPAPKPEAVKITSKNISQTAKPMSVKTTTTPSIPQPKSMAAKGALAGYKIQLGAYRSPAALEEDWQRLKKRFPKVLGSLRYAMQKADLGSKGLFYRLQAGPLKSADAAKAACKQLIAANQGCFVVE